MRDRYLEILIENQPDILMLYQKFADKKPVMLYDIQERRIYAMPDREYRATSERSQIFFEEAVRARDDGRRHSCLRQRQRKRKAGIVQLASVI